MIGGVIICWPGRKRCAEVRIPHRTGYKVPSGGGGGGPVAAEDAAPIAALGSEAWLSTASRTWMRA